MSMLSHEKGLTLPEVLIASAVLAVGILAIAGMFPSAYQNVKYGGEITRATALAQEIMEILRNESFANLCCVSYPTSYNELNTSACGSRTTALDTNCRKWRDDIAAVGLPSGSGSIKVVPETSDLRKITVTVSWTERYGNKKVELMTYAVRY